MAGASFLSTSDPLLVLRLQLFEAEIGSVSTRAPSVLPQHASPQACSQRDLSLASEQDMPLHHGSLHAQSVASRSPTSSDVMHTNPAIPPLSCPICLELCPASSRFITPCKHVFCTTCIRKHLTLVATETKQFPLTCPSCRAELDPQQCLSVLAGTQAYHDLESLLMEKMFHVQLRYCANEECAAAFDWEEDGRLRRYSDRYRVECPLCQYATCVKCRVLWHNNRSCEQYQGDREGRDLLVRLARREQWMACPDCGQVIDRRREDCYFVRCRCGCGFCHKCGTKYLSTQETRENAHGRPGCRCDLFEYEEELVQEDEAVAEEVEYNLHQQLVEPPALLQNSATDVALGEILVSIAGILVNMAEEWPNRSTREDTDEMIRGSPNGFWALQNLLRKVGIQRKHHSSRSVQEYRRYRRSKFFVFFAKLMWTLLITHRRRRRHRRR